MTIALPTEKNQPASEGLLYRRILLYGVEKVGKTTAAVNFTENPLIIDTEGGSEGYGVYRIPCPDWPTFRTIGASLAGGGIKKYTALVVDTVDELARACQEHVIGALAGRENDLDKGDYFHPSDFEYGKGWSAVTEEFRLRLAKLCNLGLPVLLISHERDQEVKSRAGTITVMSADVGNSGIRKWLGGFVDVTLRATVMQTTEGSRRVIQAQPSPETIVGGRTPDGGKPLPEYFSLSGAALLRALSERLPEPVKNDRKGNAAKESQPDPDPEPESAPTPESDDDPPEEPVQREDQQTLAEAA